MFKFLKSKKGFTLVELMIVVVIMAILVAVAVPIYSAVTANAKKKTCIANMREIVAQLNNYAMSQGKNLKGTITISSDGSKGSVESGDTVTDNGFGADGDFVKMFQTLPGCPAGGTYTVKMGAGSGTEDGSVSVQIKCGSPADDDDFDDDDIEGHTYGTFTE